MFYNVLNIVGVNSIVLSHDSCAAERKSLLFANFVKRLAMDLNTPHMKSHLQFVSLPCQLHEPIMRITKCKAQQDQPPTRVEPSSRRHYFCPKSQDRNSRTECQHCKSHLSSSTIDLSTLCIVSLNHLYSSSKQWPNLPIN